MHWGYRNFWIFSGLALILSSISNGLAEQRVVCYYTNWSVYRPGTAKFTPQNINPYLCTHLIYAFGGFTKDNTLKPFDKYQDIEKGGYAKFTGLKTYNKNLKTMLAIGGWNEGSTRFSPMVADAERRREFVKNSVKFLRQNHFDGLDLDWEYPAFRDGGKPRDKDNYADLVQELREEFERESSKTGRPRLLLSMAIPAGIEYLEKGYDLPRLNEYLDFFNLLSYDYHSAFEPAVNHHAPLYGLEEDNEYNYDSELTIDYTISYLIRHDVSSDKIVLGIPTYGRSYTLFNVDATEIGSPADGPGEEGDATREKGYLAYYEICESIAKSDDWEVVQPNAKAMGPYAFKDNQWVGYDDEDIVRVKARYVNEKQLGGIMFWSIDNDDFRGKCHGRSYPLIEAAKEAMLTENGKTKASPKSRPSGSSRKDSRHRLQGDSTRRFRGSTSTAAPTRRRPSADRFNSRSRSRTSGEQSDKSRNDKDRGFARVTTPKSRPRLRSSTRGNRVNGRKKPDTRDDDLNKDRDLEKSQQTTPEPPTTPDPGTDFKCEDEGFFPHPRDCKKYFWCLDAGPGGLGIVAHQFTCPSGLVFNKLADSCDYPRNVVCPKTKPATTTKKTPTTTPTVRTTTTTPMPDSAEESEYEDENLYSAEEIEEENTVKSTTTAKPLIYKIISRARPTTATSTTYLTTPSPSTTRQKTPVDILADEEDPRVIKELIELIKKAGGIEQLEKQLHLQDKDADVLDSVKDPELITPAAISRSLYERVLSRQSTAGLADFEATPDPSSATTLRTTTAKIRYLNGPGGAQFAGLDDIPEVQSLRRISKPQYVTIERQRTKVEPEEDIQQDSSDIALSENQAIGQIAENNEDIIKKSGPSYVNIRRSRPTTFTSDNDLEETASTPTTSALVSESSDGELKQESPPPKSRYTNIARFRSTTKSSLSTIVSETPQLEENQEIPETTPLTIEEKISESPITNPTEFLSSSASLTTEPATTTTEAPPTRSISAFLPQPTESMVIPSSEIPQTTTNLPNAETTISRSTAVVLQPRPFGYPRRTRPSTTVSTTGPSRKVSTRPPNNASTRSREQLDENGLDVRPKSEKTVSTRAPTARRRGTVRYNLVTSTNPTIEVTKRYSTQEETTLYPSRRRSRPSKWTSEAPAPNKRRRRPVSKPDSPIIRIIPTDFDGNTSILSANSTPESVKITNITISEYKTINDSLLRMKNLTEMPYSLLTPLALDNNAISEVETTTIREDINESTGVSRRKVLLRRRLIGKNVDSPAPTVNITMRRRKVVRKIGPVTAKPLDSDKYSTDTFTTEENARTTTIDNEMDDYTTTEVMPTTNNLSTDNLETVETTTMDYSSLSTIPETTTTTPPRKVADVKTSRFVRKKIIRKPVGAILTTQQPNLSANRRKHLFVRRRPITTPKPEEIDGNFDNGVNNENGSIVDEKNTVVSEKMDSTAAASAEKTENITMDIENSKLPTLRELIEKYLIDDNENFLEKHISTRILDNKSSDIVIGPELTEKEMKMDSIDVVNNLNQNATDNNSIKGDDQTVAESELFKINDGDLILKIGILHNPSNDEGSNNRKEENSTDEMSVYRSTLGTTRTSGSSTRDRLRTSVKKNDLDDTEHGIVTIKTRETYDQSGRAQEMAVSVAEAPTSMASIESGRETSSRFRGIQKHHHRVRTKAELPAISSVRQRHQRPPAVEVTSRAPRPVILDYDYYDNEDARFSVRSELKNKIYITRRGGIGCLDQGNFAHPTSCKKFITCAKMVNGQVIATEYTCPAKLSFDPVGGICNWSAGLGCKEQSFNS